MVTERQASLLIRVAVALFGLAITCVSVLQLSKFANYADAQYWARQIEWGRSFDDAARSTLERTASSLMDGRECQGRFLKAGVTLSLAALDAAATNTSGSAREQSLYTAEKLLRHATDCAPTDGNFWLRRAMVSQARHASAVEIGALVMLSQRYAPYDGGVIKGRFMLFQRMSKDELLHANAALIADLKTVCTLKPNAYRALDLPAMSGDLQSTISRLGGDCRPTDSNDRRSSGRA